MILRSLALAICIFALNAWADPQDAADARPTGGLEWSFDSFQNAPNSKEKSRIRAFVEDLLPPEKVPAGNPGAPDAAKVD